MHGIFLAVLIMACTAHFSVAVEIPQPWNVVIESPDFLNASPEKQKQIRQQWEKDYRENEAVNTVMMDLWNKHPELHTDTNEYFGFMARRDNYLHQGKPMSEALKLAGAETFPQARALDGETAKTVPLDKLIQETSKQDASNKIDKVPNRKYLTEKEVVGENTFQQQQQTSKTDNAFLNKFRSPEGNTSDDDTFIDKFLAVLYIILIVILASLLYLLPYLLIRFFAGHPISRKPAIIICIVTWIVFHFGFSIAGKQNAVGMIVPFTFAGYYVLTRKPRRSESIASPSPTVP